MHRYSKFRRTVAITILFAGVAGAFYYFKQSFVQVNTSDFRIGKVVRETLIQRVTIAGKVEPVRSTQIAAPYEGYIKKLFVGIGDQVSAGNPLVSIAQSLQTREDVFPIRSPFTGTITQILKTEGQAVKPGDRDAILRLDDLSQMFINANAPEIDLLKIKPDLEALVKISAVVSRSYRGRVREIALAATSNEQWGGRGQVEYLVKIEIEDADSLIKPGMSAVVDIVTNKKENVISLAHEFIHSEGESYFVILKDGSRRDIKVGLQNETAFEILEGISEGEEVRQVDFLKLIEASQ